MKKLLIPVVILLCSSFIYSTIPPKDGIKPPSHFWEFQRMVQTQYSEGYYAQKFRDREHIREQIANGLLPELTLEQDTVFALTLLGQYSNLPATYSQQDFQNLLFDGNSPTGTITDYYSEISYNQLHFTGTSAGWYNMPRTLQEYVGNNNGLGTQGGPRFALEAVLIADSTINFADYIQYYDAQNRPRIGFFAVVHSGAGAEQGANNIWSHRWNFRVINGGQPYVTNDIDPISGQNVIIDGDYAIQPEMDGGNNQGGPLITIGVFAHEFGHIFGLPDLYDTDGSSQGLGNWCLMASGNYGGNGSTSHTPAHMSAWCKKKLGWVTPVNITTALDSLVVPNVEENAVLYRMWKEGTMGLQYFLIENRQKILFDRFLYNSGFLIYHVDESMPGNQNENRYLVDLEQADGFRHLNNNSGRGDAGDPFPGSTNNTRFDINTNPNSKDYALQNTYVSLRNIRHSELDMIADFDIGTRPYLELNNVFISERNSHNGRVEPGETGNVNFSLSNISLANSSNTRVSYSLLADGITINSNELITTLNGATSETITIDSAFFVMNNFEPNTLTLNFEVTCEGNEIFGDTEVVIGIPGILLISKSENESFGDFYTSAFAELGKKYEQSKNKIPEFIHQRDVIIVFTSKKIENIFTQTEIDSFSSFIAGGGRIMLTGEHFANNLQSEYPDFLHNEIGIGWESNQIFPNYAYGIPEDMFGNQLNTLRIRGAGGANNQAIPDVLTKIDTSFHFSLTYLSNGTKPAGGWVIKPNGAKIVFWGFGFEGIVDDQSSLSRTQVMNKILQWFDGTLDAENDNLFTVANYKIYQNYPNPFNPSTTIKYEVPHISFVTIKVFDILGREVTTIVNEEKPSGSHTASFDASSLSSGVYIYRINALSRGKVLFSQTKTMTLIK